jgi:hypothetical protein
MQLAALPLLAVPLFTNHIDIQSMGYESDDAA